MFHFQHKTALVTGASGGIGEAIAEQLAEQQCNLVIVARRLERLEQLKVKLEQQHGIKVTVMSCDLTLSSASADIYKHIKTLGIDVDVLINNAGIGLHGSFLDAPSAQHSSLLAINVTALTELTHLFASDMKARGQGGAILLVASIGGLTPVPQFASYAASKAYVLSFGQALSHELKQDGIGVTVLAPGGTATDFMNASGMDIEGWRTQLLMTSATVARLSLKALAKGKRVIVPGLLNKLMCLFLVHAPNSIKMPLSEMATKKS